MPFTWVGFQHVIYVIVCLIYGYRIVRYGIYHTKYNNR